MEINFNVNRLSVLKGFAVIITLLHLANVFAVWLRYSPDISQLERMYVQLLGVSGEGRIPTWYSTITLLVCVLLMYVIGVCVRRSGKKYSYYWFALSVIFAAMSLDEGFQIHESLSEVARTVLNIQGGMFAHNSWVIFGIAFVILFALVFARFFFYQENQVKSWMAIGGLCYLLGVVGFELVGAFYLYTTEGVADITYGVIASVEEIFEMVGMAIFIVGLITKLQKNQYQISINVLA